MERTGYRIICQKVYDFIDTLADFPEIGTIENKQKEIRGFAIVKQISIFYHIDKHKIKYCKAKKGAECLSASGGQILQLQRFNEPLVS